MMEDRFYYAKLFASERRIFKRLLHEWLRGHIDRPSDLANALARIGRDRMHPYDIEVAARQLFKTPPFIRRGKFYEYLFAPSWFWRTVRDVYASFDGSNRAKRYQTYQWMWKQGINVSPLLVFKWLTNYNLPREEIIQMVEKRERLMWRALREVGRVEGDFIAAVEDGGDLEDVFNEYAHRFRAIDPTLLFMHIATCNYRPSLIDEAAVKAAGEEVGEDVPDFHAVVARKLKEGRGREALRTRA